MPQFGADRQLVPTDSLDAVCVLLGDFIFGLGFPKDKSIQDCVAAAMAGAVIRHILSLMASSSCCTDG